jgi:hypothetical protein
MLFFASVEKTYKKHKKMTKLKPTDTLNAAAQPTGTDSAIVLDMNTRQPIAQAPTQEFNHLLVNDKIVSEQDARATFQERANKIGLKGQVVGQFIMQSLMQAENLGRNFMLAQGQNIQAPKDNTMRPMQMRQQIGAILPMTDAERTALRERQYATQLAQMKPVA